MHGLPTLNPIPHSNPILHSNSNLNPNPNPIPIPNQVYTGSRFALMPWKETMNRKDLYGALMQGAIPVLFDNTTFVDYWPFAPLQHFAVQIPPSASTASGGVLQYLRDIPAAEVRAYR